MKIEFCTDNVSDALAAFQKGVNRIEYCSCLEDDGLTADLEEVRLLIHKITIPIRVMIRPTNSYQLNEQDEKKIIDSIYEFNKIKIDGIVIGYLDENQDINENFLIKITKLFPELAITFHKAIDYSNDILKSVQVLNKFNNIDCILSSGGEKSALEGANMLTKMQFLSNKSIIGAGGITFQNIDEIKIKTDLIFYHGRKIIDLNK